MHKEHKKLIKYGKFMLSNVPAFFVFYVSKYKDQYAHKCPLCRLLNLFVTLREGHRLNIMCRNRMLKIVGAKRVGWGQETGGWRKH